MFAPLAEGDESEWLLYGLLRMIIVPGHGRKQQNTDSQDACPPPEFLLGNIAEPDQMPVVVLIKRRW